MSQMTVNNEDEAAVTALLTEAGILDKDSSTTTPSTEELDYKRLAFYLQNALIQCGIDNVIQDDLIRWKSIAPAHSKDEQEALAVLCSGKQFSLKTLSYSTVFLMQDQQQQENSLKKHALHIPVDEATKPPHNFTLDQMMLGGMIPVQPKHVLLCSELWVKVFYLQPLQRLGKLSMASTLSGAPPPVSSWFVRTTAEEMQADQEDMTSKLQKLMAQAKEKKKQKEATPVFTGAGQTLGGSTTTNDGNQTTTTTAQGVFDPLQLEAPTEPSSSSSLCTIAVRRLDSGQRLVIKLPMTATVQQLAAHCAQAATGQRFSLVAGFPPKPLTDATATMEQAQLQGAQVVMKKAA